MCNKGSIHLDTSLLEQTGADDWSDTHFRTKDDNSRNLRSTRIDEKDGVYRTRIGPVLLKFRATDPQDGLRQIPEDPGS